VGALHSRIARQCGRRSPDGRQRRALGVSWNSITQYTLVFPGQHVFAAAPTGTSQTIGKSVTMTLGAPVTSNGTTILSRTTIVLGGQSGKNTAALYVFTQPTFNTNPGQATVVYGNAAPDSSAPITFGIVPTNALNATPAASASLAVGSLSGLTSIPASSSTTSVAVSAVPSGGTQSVIFPASIDGNDAGNVLPFNNNVDLNLSVFAIDAPIGTPNATGSVKLLGAFDPNN